MHAIKGPLPLKKLLEYCCEPGNPQWEYAWNIFIKRYNDFIYSRVSKRCYEWNATRFKRQITDVVNDIVAEVYGRIYANEFQSLRNFRERENEAAFHLWLSTICSRTTSRFIKRYYPQWLEDLDEMKQYFHEIEHFKRWEIYENIVSLARSSAKKESKNLEPTIHIFLLSIWPDFSKPMLRMHPCITGINDHNIDIIVSRFRKKLRKNREK